MTRRKLQTGFSLLEMAMGLAILGFLFAMLPAGLSVLGKVQNASPALDRLETAISSAVGFVVQHDRLPCPDTTGDGLENCGGARSGRYPYRSVGLAAPLVNERGFAFQYAVYRDPAANLAALQGSFSPALLGGGASPGNALDFCQGLRLGLSAGLRNNEPVAGGINPAFLFADPGQQDADRDGRPFDGNNARGLAFESAARQQDENYDDRVTTVSFAELAARLGCPQLMARVSAAAREANAAYDAWRAYEFYVDFRAFGVDVRKTNLDIAELKRTIALFNSALSIAMGLNDLATGLSSASGAASIAATLVTAAAAGYAISEELSGSAQEVADKKDELELAREQLEAARTARDAALDYRQRTLAAAQAADAAGWFQ